MKRAVLVALFLHMAGTLCLAQQFTYYYPQIASGTYDGGSWKTTIFITNSSSGIASGTIMFTKSDGSAFNLPFIDDTNQAVGAGNMIPFQLGAGQTRKFVSVLNGPLATGYATVSANMAVVGAAMFTQFNAAGRMLGEAGVPASIPLGKQAVLVDTLSDFKTGLAIANPTNATLHITFELVSAAGVILMNSTRDLPANQHFSTFVHELFPTAPPMVGRLQFFCTNPMVSVALRFEPSFVLFTTMPAVPVAALTSEPGFLAFDGLTTRYSD